MILNFICKLFYLFLLNLLTFEAYVKAVADPEKIKRGVGLCMTNGGRCYHWASRRRRWKAAKGGRWRVGRLELPAAAAEKWRKERQ